MARLSQTPQGMERRTDGVYVMLVEEPEAIHIDEIMAPALEAIARTIMLGVAPTAAGNRLAINRFMADKDVYWLDDVEDREDGQELDGDEAESGETDKHDEVSQETDDQPQPEDQDADGDQDQDDTDEGDSQDDGETDESQDEDDTEDESDQDDQSQSQGEDESESDEEPPPVEFKMRHAENGEEAWVPFGTVVDAVAQLLGTPAPTEDGPVSPETSPAPVKSRTVPTLGKPQVDESQYKDGGRMYHEMEPEVIAAAMGGQHVFLYGPPGTGKSHMATRYAGLTGQQLDIVSCHPHLTVSSLVGYITPNGLQPGPMLLSARAEGVLCLDEVDNTGPGVHASANSSMANNLIQIQDERIAIGPAWRVFMTANTMGQGATADFVGRQKLDAATLDRVASFFINTDPVLEHNLLVAMGMPADLLKEWIAIVRRMRDNVDHHGLRCFVSMRTTLAGAKQLMLQQQPAWRRAGYKVLSPMDIARMRVLSKLPVEQAAKVLD